MKLFIGGVAQRKGEYVRLHTGLNPGMCTPEEGLKAQAIDRFHRITRQLLEEGKSPQEYARRLLRENPEVIVVCDEIGQGIVPADPFERAWREETGRALCILAQEAEEVTRVSYGVGVRLK